MEITPEMQAAINAAVETATAGLKSKRDALINENRALQTAKEESDLAAETANEEAQRKSGDIEALEKTLTDKHTRALNLLQAERDAAIADRDMAIKTSTDKDINDALRSSMIENNVPKHLHGPLTAYLRKDIEVVDGAAVFSGKPLADALPAYFKSDEGKAYVVAPANVGTGSTGVRNSTADEWANPPKTPDEQFRFSKLSSEDPAAYNNLCDRFNMADRKV